MDVNVANEEIKLHQTAYTKVYLHSSIGWSSDDGVNSSSTFGSIVRLILKLENLITTYFQGRSFEDIVLLLKAVVSEKILPSHISND